MWLACKGQAVWDASGKPVKMSGFFTDITHAKSNEKLKNDFLSTLSHQLRTPLTSVKGSLGLLLSGVGGDINYKAKNLLEIANKNCEKLISIINDILDIDKMETGNIDFNLEYISIPELLMESLQINASYAEKYNIEFNLMEPLLDVTVYADRARLLQVLSNLIGNAAKFSPLLGKVDIGTIDRDQFVRIYVTDHGHGIPEANRKHIFDKFTTPNQNGITQLSETGVGLNISKAIIEHFNGKLDFDTEIGRGTTFYFDVPKQAKDAKRGNWKLSDGN
jgi:signal transduction histidine kinase